jgi:hypothetical protein
MNSELYFLRNGLSKEVSLGIPFHLKKKVRGGSALPGGDMQKPYTPKCGQGKTKNDLFRDFFTVMNFIPVKFPHCIVVLVIFSKKLLCKVSIFFTSRLSSRKVYQKKIKKWGLSFKKIIDDVIIRI